MTRPEFEAIFPDPLDAECCAGYWDGRRPDSPDPGSNRHPAYVHGFLNGRDDLRKQPRKTAAEIRSDWKLIEAVFSEGAGK